MPSGNRARGQNPVRIAGSTIGHRRSRHSGPWSRLLRTLVPSGRLPPGCATVALARRPHSMLRDITRSAGTTRARQPTTSGQGAACRRQRKTRRVCRPPSTAASAKAHVQSALAQPRTRQRRGRCVCERSTRHRPGSRISTTKPHSVSGGPSGTKSPTRRCCSSSTIWVALASLAGKSMRSTQRAVYQPARCQPICTSQGQTSSGGTRIVAACVTLIWGAVTSWSPGSEQRRSAGVAPRVSLSHREVCWRAVANDDAAQRAKLASGRRRIVPPDDTRLMGVRS
jgi:hypothetical protein